MFLVCVLDHDGRQGLGTAAPALWLTKADRSTDCKSVGLSEKVIAAKQAGLNNYTANTFNAQTVHNEVKAIFSDESSSPGRRLEPTGRRALHPLRGFV